ncbi:SUMO-interacting motif-containing protein 1 [Anthophora quadrimaculata]
MRLILVILIFFTETVLSTYYEKRRFDRSVYDDFETSNVNHRLIKKQWTFTDYTTCFRAYKDREESNCYLEKLEENAVTEELPKNRKQQRKHTSKILYAPNEALTKLEAWQIAGGRIVDFCNARKIILLQTTMPIPGQTIDPFFNTLPQDENDIVARRVADVVLTPLISRAKRQIVLEEREKLNANFRKNRFRRQAQPPGKFHGQTQSQYLNINNNNDQAEGKAEAEALPHASRAAVSGSHGMGQAQSMSLGIGCEDCSKYTSEGAPDRYIQHPGTSTGRISLPKTTGGTAGTLTGGANIHPGMITPGMGTPYPSKITPGITKTTGEVPYPGRVPGSTTGGHMIYTSNIPGTTTVGGGEIHYPRTTTTGSRPAYPGSVGGTTTGGGTMYPGGVVPPAGGTVPYPGGTPGGGAYPGRVTGPSAEGTVPYPGGIPSGGTYPGRVAGPSAGGTVPYPGGIPGGTTGSGAYPGGVVGPPSGGTIPYPGTTPGVTTGSGTYPGGVVGPPSGGTIPYPGAISHGTTGSGAYPGGVVGPPSGGTIPYPGGIPGGTTGSGVYPGGVVGPSAGGTVPYSGGIPSSTTRGGTIYPGGVSSRQTGGTVPYSGEVVGPATGGGTVHPGGGSVPTTGGTISYPSGVPDGTTGSVVYPGGIVSYPEGVGGSLTGRVVPYPGSVSGVATGNVAIYPGGVATPPAGETVAYPGGVVPGFTTGSGTVYPGGVAGSTTGETIPYPGRVPSTAIGSDAVYPGGVAGTRGNIPYPENVPGVMPDGSAAYPDGTRGSLTPGRLGTYPGSGVPDTKETNRGQITTESKATADTTIYPNGQIPRTQFFGGDPYSRSRGGDTTTGEVIPGDASNRGTIPGTSDTRPNSGGTYTGGTIPSTAGHFMRGDHTRYPGSTFPQPTRQDIGPGIIKTDVTSDAGSILSYPDGSRVQARPDNAYLQKVGTDQSGIPYPPGIIQYPDGSRVQLPETGTYPNNRGIISPNYPLQQGQYPGTTTWLNRGIPTSGLPRDSLSGGISRQGLEQYPTDGQGTRQQYPGLQYLPNVGQTGTGEPAQYQQPGGYLPEEGDNANSQASSSVKQTDSGTQASASAQGKLGQGTAQSQVTGTYSGSGSFSAQAGSTDNNKSAQTEVSGGKEGATSNAQGVGGYGKSQAQVQLNSDSGATTTGAQSSGWNHGTNSQVQASSKGGMADAQANGEGSTSSQAQIGFQPYLKTDEKIEKHSKPFRGGGTASAQSGTYTGQSQSQLEGSFQYGITYTGAAQAGSGSGAATSRKPFNFNITDTELFKPFKPSYIPQIVQNSSSEVTNASSDTNYEYNQDQQGLQTSSSSRKTVTTKPTDGNSQNEANKLNPPMEKSQTDDTLYDYEEEYDNEDYDASPMQTSMNSKISKVYTDEQNSSNHQSQAIHVTTGNQYDLHFKQNTNAAQVGDMLHPGQSLAGYTIPPGFRGRVTSVAGSETNAYGDGKSQSQTVSLVPKEPSTTRENKSPISDIRSLKTNHERLMKSHASSREKQKNNFPQQSSTEYSKPTSTILMKPNYYTVTNSVAGKMDDRNSPRKYEHRYYTKSSTCGYFTFSCNIVYGSNGRTKICKPKVPTYPDGTPMKC